MTARSALRSVVLGASGFIGAQVWERLSRTMPSLGLSSEQCDLRDAARCLHVLPALTRDALVVHAAGIPRLASDSMETMRRNVDMTCNLLRVFSEAPPRKVVFLSSAEVYGTPESLPITEDTPFRPMTNYAVGKITSELLLRKWHAETGIPLAILRLPGIYGAGDKGHGLVGVAVSAAQERRTLTLHAAGREQRDFVFVDDVARAISLLAQKTFSEWIINVATGEALPVADIVKRVFSIHGPTSIESQPVEKHLCHLRFDVTRLHTLLPELQMTGLESGIRTSALFRVRSPESTREGR